MMGARILFIIVVINLGLVMVYPATFMSNNYAVDTISSAFGFDANVTQTLDSSGMNITLMNEDQNTTTDSLGLTEGGADI